MRLLILATLCWLASLAASAQSLEQALREAHPRSRITQLNRVIARSPSAEAYYHRANAWLDLNEPARALPDLRAAQRNPGKLAVATLHAAEAQAYFQLGRYADGVRLATQALAPNPKYPYGLLVLAQNQMGVGANADARTTLERLLALEPDNRNGHYLLAAVLLNLNQPIEALRIVNRALVREPNQPDLRLRRLLVLDRLGRQTEAHALADSLASEAGSDPVALANLAATSAQQENWRYATALYGRAIQITSARLQVNPNLGTQIKPFLYQTLLQRGDASLALRDYEQALADYTSAINHLPNRSDAYERIGQLQTLQGNWREAVTAYEQCFRLNSQYKSGWANLGYAYSKQKLPDQALAAYTRALAVPVVADRPLLLNNRGYLYLNRKDYPAALRDLQACVQADPSFPTGHISLGEYYLTVDDFPAAIRQFDKVLALPRTTPDERWLALYRRSAAKAASGQPAAAEADLKAAIAQDAGMADAYDALGLLYEALDRPCDARRILEQGSTKIRRNDPLDPAVPRLLGRLQANGLGGG